MLNGILWGIGFAIGYLAVTLAFIALGLLKPIGKLFAKIIERLSENMDY